MNVAGLALFAHLWWPMLLPELDPEAYRPRRKRPYGERGLCPYSEAELAAAQVLPVGDGDERIYEVAVAGQVVGAVYRSRGGKEWRVHPAGTQDPHRRFVPPRAQAIAALLSRPGALWCDADLTIVH